MRVTHYSADLFIDYSTTKYRLNLFIANPDEAVSALALSIVWQADIKPAPGTSRWYGHTLQLPYTARSSADLRQIAQVLAWLERRTGVDAQFGRGSEPQQYLSALEKARAIEVIHDLRIHRWLRPSEIGNEWWKGYIAQTASGVALHGVVAENEDVARAMLMQEMTAKAKKSDYSTRQLERWAKDGYLIKVTSANSQPGWSRTARQKAEEIESIGKVERLAERR